MLVERGDAKVDLFFRHDQRRRNHEVAHPGLLRDSIGHHLRGNLIHDKRLAFDLVAHRIEGLLRLPVLHKLNRKEETQSAHIAYRRMLGFKSFELFAHVRLKFRCTLDELESLCDSSRALATPQTSQL